MSKRAGRPLYGYDLIRLGIRRRLEPFGELAPLAAGLSARGHKIALVLRDSSRARQIIPDRAVSIYQAPSNLHAAEPNAEPHTFAQILAHVGFGRADELKNIGRSLGQFVSGGSPRRDRLRP